LRRGYIRGSLGKRVDFRVRKAAIRAAHLGRIKHEADRPRSPEDRGRDIFVIGLAAHDRPALGGMGKLMREELLALAATRRIFPRRKADIGARGISPGADGDGGRGGLSRACRQLNGRISFIPFLVRRV
jgi:hypothetical protein